MKERLDVLVYNLGLAPSRERAKALIMEGKVYVKGQKEDKPGSSFDIYAPIEVRGATLKYVSRGGLKLEKAIDTWPISLENKVCMDIGASTGGFTDCMLQNGAKEVYAIDVGYGQLHWNLRNDERVHNLEKTNVRFLTHEQVPEKISFASVDVSFISLKLILPVLKEFLSEDGEAVTLIKPQFEAGREKVGKKGVVREPETHVEVCENVLEEAKNLGFYIRGLTYSPVKGPEGNIEYLLYISKKEEGEVFETDPKKVVSESHETLNKSET